MSVFHTLYFMHASFNYGFLPLSSSILLLFPLPTLPLSAYLPYAPYHSLLQPGSAGGTLCVITARAESPSLLSVRVLLLSLYLSLPLKNSPYILFSLKRSFSSALRFLT